MEARKCVLCGRDVQGYCDGVKLTFCCAHCCVRTEPEKQRRRVTRQRAIREYHCTGKDLRRLDYDPKLPPATVFQLAEVKYLGDMNKNKHVQKSKEKDSRRRIRRAKRDVRARQTFLKSPPNKLLRRLKVVRGRRNRPGDGNKMWWHLLLEKYLRRATRTRSELLDVKESFTVMDRVEQIMASCQGAHPGTVFEFCLAHPNAGPAEFQELKNKVRLVFYHLGERILSQLSRVDLLRLEKTPLAKEAREFQEHKHGIVPIRFVHSMKADWKLSSVADHVYFQKNPRTGQVADIDEISKLGNSYREMKKAKTNARYLCFLAFTRVIWRCLRLRGLRPRGTKRTDSVRVPCCFGRCICEVMRTQGRGFDICICEARFEERGHLSRCLCEAKLRRSAPHKGTCLFGRCVCEAMRTQDDVNFDICLCEAKLKRGGRMNRCLCEAKLRRLAPLSGPCFGCCFCEVMLGQDISSDMCLCKANFKKYGYLDCCLGEKRFEKYDYLDCCLCERRFEKYGYVDSHLCDEELYHGSKSGCCFCEVKLNQDVYFEFCICDAEFNIDESSRHVLELASKRKRAKDKCKAKAW